MALLLLFIWGGIYMNVTLENGYLEVLLMSNGGTINKIRNKKTGLDYYWDYNSKIWPRRTSVCFPICGNLTDDQYVYGGKTYSLPAHGFLREKDLNLLYSNYASASFSLTSDETTKPIYPFDFRFLINYELDRNALIVRYVVKNTGSGIMYYSVGSHYTYRVPFCQKESFESYQYTFAGPQKAGKVELENGQVSGITDDIFHGRDYLSIQGVFGAGSTILRCDDLTQNRIGIQSQSSGAKVEVSFDGFSHVILWAPYNGAPFACIEPWAGMVDAKTDNRDITHKLGIVSLEAGATRTYTQIISVS